MKRRPPPPGAPPARPPPLVAFAALSAGLHAWAFAAAIHRAATTAAPTFDATSQPLSGDTLDVEPPAPSPDDTDLPPSTPTSRALSAPTPTSAPGSTPSPSFARTPVHGADAAAGASAAPPALYGAAGVPFAADLATSFTRAFPQAASADPIWMNVPFGAAGRAELVLVLDDTGHIAQSAIGGAPSTALRRGIERTVAILEPRVFTARSANTKLRISAHVSRDDVHDGLHGDVFALSGGSFSGAVGNAFFALPQGAGTGRRIDVELRILP